ncbi:hypothetical protein FRC04_000936 [Tulasnella sp. 424]|nr:hypothetical protein FRC04_000936 [Tulasnella sp. 424]
MSEYFFLDGVVCNAAPDKRTSEKAPAPAPAAIRNTTSPCCVDSRSSISPDGRPTLPLELLIEIIEQLAVPQARSSFTLDKMSFKTLVSLALLNQTFNAWVTPILYRRIRLVTPDAIRSTVKTYFDANRLCLRDGSYQPPREQHQPQKTTSGSTQPAEREHWIDPKAQISSDSMVGPSTKIAERTSIKKSVIGSHCVIGRNLRIFGCVLIDHVVVKDGSAAREILFRQV